MKYMEYDESEYFNFGYFEPDGNENKHELCKCGHPQSDHFNAGERNVCGGGEWNGDIHDDNGCKCDGFIKQREE